MIGWTKHRKRCPEHGLILRKKNQYSEKANYCPACGEQLVLVSVPYLFQVYFNPICTGVLAAFLFVGGLFFFFDVRGCVIEDRQATSIVDEQKEAERQARREEQSEGRKRTIETLPPEWKTLYAGMTAISRSSEKWTAFNTYFQRNASIKLPALSPEQIKLFIDMFRVRNEDDGFALIMKHMKHMKQGEER